MRKYCDNSDRHAFEDICQSKFDAKGYSRLNMCINKSQVHQTNLCQFRICKGQENKSENLYTIPVPAARISGLGRVSPRYPRKAASQRERDVETSVWWISAFGIPLCCKNDRIGGSSPGYPRFGSGHEPWVPVTQQLQSLTRTRSISTSPHQI